MGLRFRTRLSLTVTLLLVLTVAAMSVVLISTMMANAGALYREKGTELNQLTERNIEYGLALPEKVMHRVCDQLLVNGLVISELLALVDKSETLSRDDINDILVRVIEESKEIYGYPLIDGFRISESGHKPITATADGYHFTDMANDKSLEALFDPSSDTAPVIQNNSVLPEKSAVVTIAGPGESSVIQVGIGQKLSESITKQFHVQNIVDRFMIDMDLERIIVIAPDGEVIASSESHHEDNTEKTNAAKHDAISFCINFLKGDDEYAIKTFQDDLGVVSRLDIDSFDEPFALFIQYQTSEGLLHIYGRMFTIAGIGVFMIILGAIAAGFLSRGLTKPLDALAKGAKEFGEGNLNHRVFIERNDEFQGLAQSFNSMAISLQEHMCELKREASNRERLESEVRIASDIQRTLLPKNPPAIDGYQLMGWCKPAKRVGGDFYDFIDIGNGRFGIVLGDATGKGMPAALLSTKCSSTIRTLAHQFQDPAQLLDITNRVLHQQIGASHRFITLFFMIIESGTGRARYALAGHNPPFLVNPDTGRKECLDRSSGFPLAVMHDAEYQNVDIDLEPGDTIMIYSDGLTDAQNTGGEAYGEDTFAKKLEDVARAPLDDVIKHLRRDVRRHARGREAFDDMTLVGLRRVSNKQ